MGAAYFAVPALAQTHGAGAGYSLNDQGVQYPAVQPVVVEQAFVARPYVGSPRNSEPRVQFSVGKINVNVEPLRFKDWNNSVAPKRTLPTGRRYLYGNRYFGTINNRFYGPQYGNF